jgi:hypothetical protein
MIGARAVRTRKVLGNAALALQKKVEERMRMTGRWRWQEAADAILAEDSDLRERFNAETKRGLTPR